MAWLLLVVAGLFEVGWAIGLKYTEGFTRLWPSIGTALGYGVSFFLLSIVLKTVPVGTAYAIWSAVGTALVAAIGMVFFHESATVARLSGLALIIVGVVILNLADNKSPGLS